MNNVNNNPSASIITNIKEPQVSCFKNFIKKVSQDIAESNITVAEIKNLLDRLITVKNVDNPQLKPALKEIKAQLQTKYKEINYVDIGIAQAATEYANYNIKEELKKLEKELTGLKDTTNFTAKDGQTEVMLNFFIESIADIMKKFSTEEITTKNLLKASEIFIQANDMLNDIKLINQKKALECYLAELPSNTDTLGEAEKEKATHTLQKLLNNDENTAVFARFPEVYKKSLEKYLSLTNCNPNNFDYNDAVANIQEKYLISETSEDTNPEEKKQLNIQQLKTSILELAEKIENMLNFIKYN